MAGIGNTLSFIANGKMMVRHVNKHLKHDSCESRKLSFTIMVMQIRQRRPLYKSQTYPERDAVFVTVKIFHARRLKYFAEGKTMKIFRRRGDCINVFF